jgi:hypothetical protein
MNVRIAVGSILSMTSVAFSCAAADLSSTDEASDAAALIGDQQGWAEHVNVRAGRLTFKREVAQRTAFQNALNRITIYQRTHDDLAKMASSQLDASELETWIADRLGQAGVQPVYLVGARQSDALLPSGLVRKDVPNPNGYLRRAVAFSNGDNGDVEVVTVPATIFEAHAELRQLGFAEFSDLPVQDVPDDGSSDQWSWNKQYPFTLANIDLSTVLYQREIGAGIGNVTIGLKDSYFTVDGSLDAGAAGRWASPREAHAILAVNAAGQIVLDGLFDGAFGASSGKIELYQQSFNIASFGGFPLTLDFGVVANCDVAANGQADAQAGISLTGSLTAGGTYHKGQGFKAVWQPQWPKTTLVGPTVTSNARVDGKCSVTTQAVIQLFDAAGPEATAGGFVKLDANAQNGSGRAKVIGGIDATLGGSLRPFGIKLATISTTPFHKEWTLFDAPIQF